MSSLSVKKLDSLKPDLTIQKGKDYKVVVSEIDAEIAEQLQALETNKQLRERLLEQAEAAKLENQEDLKKQRAALMIEAGEWTQKARLYKETKDIDRALSAVQKCHNKVAEIDEQLPRQADEPPQAATQPTGEQKNISTTKAVLMVAGLFVFTTFLFWYFGTDAVAADAANDSMRRMMNATGYRMLLNVMLWSGCILVAVSFLYFFIKDVWAWFHNRVDSPVSFHNDFLSCEPLERLRFFTQNFWAAAFLFALLYLVIMG